MQSLLENIKCLACDSSNIKSALDLGNQPLANSYLPSIDTFEETYPLGVNLCHECFHLQLTHTVDPSIIYKNYLYVSGTSNTLKEYSKWFAGYADELSRHMTHNVLDIGCNDGSQLDHFKTLGYNTFGVDPAENIYPTSSVNHSIICDFFGPAIVNKVNQTFDIITAQNVMAHNPNPYEFMQTCKALMNDDTLLIVQTSQADLVLNNEFDSIYHEHVNYFNINSMLKLSERVGLNLIDVTKTPIHGNSYVFVFSKTQNKKFNILNKIALESKLYQLKTYETWASNVSSNMQDLKNTINSYQAQGYKIIGYGAAAKGNTLLNFINIKLDLILDDNSMKHELFTPGTHIPINAPSTLTKFNKDDKIVFVPLAWNFFKEISQRIKTLRNEEHDIFLKYFPKVEIVHV